MPDPAPALPVAAIDHVVVNVQDRMDEAQACWRRLGFTLTPRGRHTLGSINHLAVFATDYLELVGVPPGGRSRPELMGWPVGLNGVVFAATDAEALHDALRQAGIACDPPLHFSRPVELPGAAKRDAAFRTVRLPAEATEAGRLYFCRHETPELVWRDSWRRHPNVALGIARVVIAAAQPDQLAALFARLFGAEAVASTADGHRLAAGLADVEIIAPAALDRRYGAAAPDPGGRAAWMAALDLRSADLASTVRALHDLPGLHIDAARVTVPAAAAMGVALSFVA